MEVEEKKAIKGGEFLLTKSDYTTIFTPEDYTEEQKMFRSSMRDFLNKEVEPIKEKFDSKEGTEIAPILLEKMGELGFHGIGVPEEYGGLNCDMKTELAFGEIASDSFAFSQSIGVHTGLGVYPILLYGTEEQKKKYLNDIVTAKLNVPIASLNLELDQMQIREKQKPYLIKIKPTSSLMDKKCGSPIQVLQMCFSCSVKLKTMRIYLA